MLTCAPFHMIEVGGAAREPVSGDVRGNEVAVVLDPDEVR